MNDNIKIIILMMSCHQDLYETQAKHMFDALQSNIDKLNLNDSISIKVYYGDSKEQYEENNIIYLKAGDNFSNTYYKTIEAFEYVNNNYEYDFILRINCSTYINIQLLYELCKYLKTNKIEDIVYTHELLYTHIITKCFVPDLNNIHILGKLMLFSNKLINIILDNKFKFMDNEKYPNAGIIIENNKIFAYIDDIAISAVMNLYHIERNEKPYNYISSFLNIKLYDTKYHTFDMCKNVLSIVVKNNFDEKNNKILQIESLKELFNNNNISDDEMKNIVQNNIKYSQGDLSVYLGFINGQHSFTLKSNIIN